MSPPIRRSGPPPRKAAPTSNTTGSDSTRGTDEFDFDSRVVHQVRCTRCGKWLSDAASKERHMGDRCAKAAD